MFSGHTIFTALKGGLNLNRKEEAQDCDLKLDLAISHNNLRATNFWYGPKSPILNKKESEECKYRHIFPTKL